jgi:TonB family protein
VLFPATAREKGIQGVVTVEVALDSRGEVQGVRILSGPAELRRATLESVLQWHFTQDAANSMRQLSVQFLAAGDQDVKAVRRDFIPSVVVSQSAPAGPLGNRIKNIQITGLPPLSRDELLKRLPVRPEDVLTFDLAEAAARTVKAFDEHLNIGFTGAGDGEITVSILLPDYK